MKSYQKIGNGLLGIVVSRRNEFTWYVRDETGSGKIAILKTRESKVINNGDKIEGWIFDWNKFENLPFITEDNFGRLPISDRMRPRYVGALNLLVNQGNTNKEDLLVHLSDLKGMFNRCIKKDQWDWYSVFSLLGKPSYRKLRSGLNLCVEARKDLKNNKQNVEKLSSIRQIGIDFRSALSGISKPSITIGKSLILSRFSAPVPSKKETDQGEPYILSQFTKAKLEKSNKKHQETLDIIRNKLEKMGYVTQYNYLIDLFCVLKLGPAIFEIKSIHQKNERSQVRHAISQLYEYRYLHNIKNAHLFIVFSSKPTEEWIIDYLKDDRQVNVIWVENGNIRGPGIDLI